LESRNKDDPRVSEGFPQGKRESRWPAQAMDPGLMGREKGEPLQSYKTEETVHASIQEETLGQIFRREDL